MSIKEWFKNIFGLSRRVLVYYLITPFIAYLALGVYVLIAYPLRLFDFEAYTELLIDMLKNTVSSQAIPVEELAKLIAIVQIIQAYIAAITTESLAPSGWGWRFIGFCSPSIWGLGGLLSSGCNIEMTNLSLRPPGPRA